MLRSGARCPGRETQSNRCCQELSWQTRLACLERDVGVIGGTMLVKAVELLADRPLETSLTQTLPYDS